VIRYIHIGTLKTGSTAIQSFMEANAERLSAQGILFPEAARHGRHKHLFLKQELRKSHGEGGPNWAALHTELKASAHPKVLVSDEGFALLDGDDVKRFRQLLGPGDAKVIAYFRDYASWLPSLYAEYTKNGRNLQDFDGYFEEALARPSQAEVIGLWADAFGWDHVHVRMFSADKLVGGDVVEDILDLLGTSRTQLGVGPDEPVRAAPGWEALEIARAVLSDVARTPGATVEDRIPLFLRGACMQAVTAAAPAGRSKAEYLSAEQRRRCDAQTAKDLAFLNQHLSGAPLELPAGKPVAERPFLPSIDQVPAATVAAAMAQLAVLLAAQVPDGTVERKRRVQRKAAAAAKSADGSTKEARRERKKAQKQAETPEQRSERKARKVSGASA
jgi:hypothetical protein